MVPPVCLTLLMLGSSGPVPVLGSCSLWMEDRLFPVRISLVRVCPNNRGDWKNEDILRCVVGYWSLGGCISLSVAAGVSVKGLLIISSSLWGSDGIAGEGASDHVVIIGQFSPSVPSAGAMVGV